MNTRTIERFSRWYVPFARRNRYKLLLLAVLIFGASLWPILTQLRINNDLASLLPEQTPSVIALKESYERFGSTDRFMIAIQSKDPQLVADLQVKIRARIQELWAEEIVTAPQIDNDNAFFKDNALLYLPVTHLERIRNNLGEIQNELGRDNLPMVVDLMGGMEDKDAPAKPKEKRVWFDASLPQELGLPDEAADAFDDFFVKAPDTNKAASEPVDEWSPKGALPAHLKTRLIGQPRDSEFFNGIVQCKLIRPSTDMEFVLHILGKADFLLAEFRDQTYSSPVLFTVEGTYEGLKEIEDLKADGNRAFAISAVLIVLLVAWFFRSLLAPIILVSQVLFACTIMLAFTALWYGQLNPFTLFVASIILGMGVDYAIHLMGTCQRYQVELGDLEQSLIHTMEHLLRPMFLAALTTVAGLLTLLIAQFTGFYEFGVIASAGILLSFSTAILGLPVLLFIIGGLPPVPKRSLLPASWDEARTMAVLRKAVVVTLVLGVGVAMFAPFAEFEHNFQNLRRPARDQGVQKGISTGVAIASSRKSSTPAAVMGDSPSQLDKLYDSLMVRMHTEKDPVLRSFLTLKTFVPSASDQEERLEVIDEIRDLIGARVFDRASAEDSTNIANLRKLVEIDETFTPEDIPEWALDLLREKDGSYGKIGFIYGSYPSWDARAVAAFQDDYGHWNFEGKPLRVFSSQFILSDVIRAVKQDSLRMGFFITAVILLTLILSLRHVRMVAASAITLLLGIVFTMGAMGLLTLLFDVGRVGIYNVIVIPTIMGVAIDSTIHLLISWVQGAGMTLRKLYDTTGRMVIASSLTTAAGFFGVLLVTHRGMRTIGELAVLGILMFLVTSLIFTPFFCKIWLQKEGDAKSFH